MFDAGAVLGIVLYFKEKVLKPLRKDVYLNRCNLPERTDLDIGAENPVTTTVTGFFLAFFEVKLKRYHFPQTTCGEDLNYMSEQY